MAGHRWCLDLAPSDLRWCDLDSAEMWTRQPQGLTSKVLAGFTPTYFSRVGRFEPPVDERDPLTGIPKNVSDYFIPRIERWWVQYLRYEAEPEALATEKQRFIYLLSALLLLKTIEDAGHVSWLPKGALLERTATSSKKTVEQVLERAAREINGPIFSEMSRLNVGEQRLSSLVQSLYEDQIDFADLDADPIGPFLEHFLGVTESLTPRLQLGMFDKNQDVHRDTSARRALGAYFTPRAYADIIARHLVLPRVRTADDVSELPVTLDLAAGSGELLCAALRQIFTVRSLRDAETARHVLAKTLYAVDVNPLALHLAKLNVLRTAIRIVPELLADGKKLPGLSANFRSANSLSLATLDRLPVADVTLLNPPFHRSGWTVSEDDEFPELREVGGRPNLAFAFYLAAVSKTREGGGIGAILPSQLLSGIQHRTVRDWIAQRVRLDTIVANYTSPFKDVLSYAGLVIGQRVEHSRACTSVAVIPGGLKFNKGDVGAMLAGAAAEPRKAAAQVSFRLIEIASSQRWNWMGESQPPARRRASRRSPRIRLGELAIDGGPYRGIEVAPLWGRDWFLFDDLGDGHARHRATHAVFNSQTRLLRECSIPNFLMKRPLFSEPSLEGVQIFAPIDDGNVGVDLAKLESTDPVAHAIGSFIAKNVLAKASDEMEIRGTAFLKDLRANRLTFRTANNYRDSSCPLVVLSRANRSPSGQGRGMLWSVWINEDGAVVPIQGLQLRMPEIEYAVAASVLLNVEMAVRPLIARAPARNMGTTEPLVTALRDWEIPDLSSDQYGGLLDEMMSLYSDYRRVAGGMKQTEAAQTSEFHRLRALGNALWNA